MYDEQDFFRYAIAVKEQNGFWDLVEEFYIRKDIQVALHMVQEWILGGYKETPQELSRFLRLCNAIHGKWEYQMARREPLRSLCK